MAQLLRQASTYLINKGLRLLILMFGCVFGMFFVTPITILTIKTPDLRGLMSRSVKF
jgi:hypothetical protein